MWLTHMEFVIDFKIVIRTLRWNSIIIL